jgi:hypothetical protein
LNDIPSFKSVKPKWSPEAINLIHHHYSNRPGEVFVESFKNCDVGRLFVEFKAYVTL